MSKEKKFMMYVDGAGPDREFDTLEEFLSEMTEFHFGECFNDGNTEVQGLTLEKHTKEHDDSESYSKDEHTLIFYKTHPKVPKKDRQYFGVHYTRYGMYRGDYVRNNELSKFFHVKRKEKKTIVVSFEEMDDIGDVK